MLRCLLVDFNSYFASVEQQVQPALRGRPVGIVPMMAETTCCIAASYEAKAFGVKTGTQVAEARKLCPGIVFVEARHPLYVEFHHRAIAAVDLVAPVEQVLSIDEMACGLPMGWGSRERATALALRIKAGLREALGECLRVSVGVAPNVFLAKQASNLQKPDGLVVLDDADLPGPLLRMQPDALTGINRGMLARLHAHGITTVAQLWRARREQLHTIWGGVGGDDFYDQLHGLPVHRPLSSRRSLGHSHVLPPELRNRDDAYAVLDRLTQKAAMRLRREGLVAGALSVGLRFAARGHMPQRWEHAARMAHTQDTQTLLHTLAALWVALPPRLPPPFKVGMVLHDLLPLAQSSAKLFNDDAQRSSLWQAVDALNTRYGKHTIYCGSAHRARDSAPMRIAFNRIPDLESEA